MDDYDEDCYTIEALPACPMQAIDAAILVVDTIGGFFRVAASFWNDGSELLMRHANYKVQQKAFAREASAEIERLVNDL